MLPKAHLTSDSRMSEWHRWVTTPLWLSGSLRLFLHRSSVYSCHLFLISSTSVQISRSVVSDSLRPHELQHARPPWPSPTPGVHSNSCPLSQWYYSTISSSIIPFSTRLQSFPASGSFPMSLFQFLHVRWSNYWSFSFSINPSNEWSRLISFRIDWLDLLAAQGTLKSLLQHHSSRASMLWCSAVFIVQLSHPYMTTGKTTALTRRTIVGNVMSLLFNMLPRLVINFLPRSKHGLISRRSLNSLDIAFITKWWIFALFTREFWRYWLPLKTSGQEPLIPSSAITIQA